MSKIKKFKFVLLTPLVVIFTGVITSCDESLDEPVALGLEQFKNENFSSQGLRSSGGTGTKVLVKDVWRGGRSDEDCSKTLEFDYSAFLSSVWYSTQRDYQSDGTFKVKKGSERYCALALTQ